MIDLLLDHHDREGALAKALLAHEEAVLDSAGRGDLGLVRAAETAVRADPAGVFTFDASASATLTVGGHSWQAGRFEPASIGALRARAAASVRRGGRVRLWLIDGGSSPTDIGSLQAFAKDDTLFQVASQFNCLESTGPHVSPVESYLRDPTQGPRASISALPGTLLRHYAAPGAGGERFVQTSGGRQVELLSEVCEPGVAVLRNGYLLVDEIADPRSFRMAVESRFDAIRVGVHDDVEVVLGYDWAGAVRAPGPRIAQVFTSTVAGGGYGTLRGVHVDICRQLLRAAYLGTLLAAVSLGRSRVVLTLIGGGVFGNPVDLIWESILWAVDEVSAAARDLSVVVNGRGLARQIDLRRADREVRDRGGFVLSWPAAGRPRIQR